MSPALSLGSKLDIPVTGNRNRDLDDSLSDDVVVIEPELSLAGLYRPSSGLNLVGEVKLTYFLPFRDDVGRAKKGPDLALGETYLLWPDPFRSPITVQIGRQRFKDDREWWYGEKLDALRFLYNKDRISLDLSVSAKLIDAAGDTRANELASGSYRFVRGGELALHTVRRTDREDPAYNPIWYGLSWREKPFKGQKLWFDLAVMRGEKKSENLRGSALDAGWIFRFNHSLKPSLTLAYAYGSGDGNPDDGVSKTFRQTGLQGNSGAFGGITKFKYYGEALNPELSNLSIWTAGLGVRPKKSVSFDFVYHLYQQPEKDDHARFKIKQSPTGKDRDIGQEMDIIFGAKITERLRMSLFAGLFSPGSAYIKRDDALSGELDLQYTF